MNHIHFVRRTACIVIAVCSSLFGVVLFVPSAFARIVRPPGGASPAVLPQAHPAVVHAVVSGGMAGWQIALVALGAALVAATVAVLVDRARTAHRRLSASAA